MPNSNMIDFNELSTASAADLIIPPDTLVKVRLNVRPGGEGEDGQLTKSKSSNALYLSVMAIVLDGPYQGQRVYDKFGVRGKQDTGPDNYAAKGKKLCRSLLESARGISPDDKSDAACSARKIKSWGDFSGLELVAEIGVERDRNNPNDLGKNVIVSGVTADHPQYAAIMAAENTVCLPAASAFVDSDTASTKAPAANPSNDEPKSSVPDWAR